MNARKIVMAWIVVGALALCAPGAEPPATDQQRPGHGRREWVRQGAGNLQLDDVADDEVRRFMTEHSPRRWEKLQQEVAPDRRESIMRAIRQQYRWMQRLKEENPQMYELRMKRLPIEDEMFYLGWRLRHDDPENPEQLRSQLRERVGAFLDSSLQERRMRLTRMRERLRQVQDDLQREETRLAEAEKNRQAMIDRGVDHVLDERVRMLKEWAGPMFAPMPRHGFEDDNSPATAPVEE